MKKVTIKDIALEAGVSVGTVQRALNNFGRLSPETRARVKKIAKDMGYEPSYIAQSLATGRTYYIGIICPHINGIYDDIINEIETAARRKDYVLCLGESKLNNKLENEYLSLMERRRVDGIIIAPFSKREDYSSIIEMGKKIPLVVIEQNIPVKELNIVVTANYFNVYNATKYLIDHNRKKIAYIHWGEEFWDSAQRERLAGYTDCMRDNNLKEMSFQASHRVMSINQNKLKEFINKEKPEIIMGQFDSYTMIIMKILQELNYKIPNDIEVMGYDDIEACEYIFPTLSTIKQPTKEIGKTAVEILLNLIKNKNISISQKQIPGTIILRETTLPDLRNISENPLKVVCK